MVIIKVYVLEFATNSETEVTQFDNPDKFPYRSSEKTRIIDNCYT